VSFLDFSLSLSFGLTPFVATSKGFQIFTTEPFAKSYEAKEGNIAVIEMLFSTSLVALILSPRRLQIQNTKVGKSTSFMADGPWKLSTCIGLTFDIATMHNMRVDVPHDGSGGQAESQATSHCP
jgi:hypothetical protein